VQALKACTGYSWDRKRISWNWTSCSGGSSGGSKKGGKKGGKKSKCPCKKGWKKCLKRNRKLC
jgi:hypothetical protein